MRKVWSLLIALLFILVSLLLPATSRGASKQAKSAGDLGYVPGQVLVKFKPGVSRQRKRASKAEAGVSGILDRVKMSGPDVYLYKLEPRREVGQTVRKLDSDKDVLIAEPNFIYKSSFTPNDPSFASEWHLKNTGQVIKAVAGKPGADISATVAWDVTKGGPIPVAIIDSGIDFTHPDLANKFWQNSGETAGNGIDDDANGYVDDINGYNFAGIKQGASNGVWSLGKNHTRERAQSIKGTGKPLTHVGLMLRRTGVPTANINISIRSALGGPNLATATVTSVETSTSDEEVYKALSASVDLAAGTTYYIVMSASESSATSYYAISDNDDGVGGYKADPYKEGMEHWFNGVSWVARAGDDFYFRTNKNANPRDDRGHGTHVSGIIGARVNNLEGGAGVSFGAQLMVLKASGSAGQFTGIAIDQAIRYAADNGAKVINMSFAGASPSALLTNAVNYAYGKGVILFASSSNEGVPTLMYPASYNNVVSVGATTNLDTSATFSNYNNMVDLSAPGKDIYSTMPTYPVGLNSDGWAQNYEFLSGTSMASPVAAGIAAMVRAYNPSLTPLEVEQLMKTHAVDLPPAGRDDSFGEGRVNAAATLNNTPVMASGENTLYKTIAGFLLLIFGIAVGVVNKKSLSS